MSNHSRLTCEKHLEHASVCISISPAESFVKFLNADIEQSIADRFEQQAAKYPNSIAVKSKTEKLTYEQLNKNANRLAQAIIAQQGEGSQAIALLLEKGASYITTIFGVLKTGKIFVPLDASFPLTRLSYIIEDSQTVLIVTNNENLALARELAVNGCDLLNIDDIDASITTTNPNIQISADTPAFIIYTSGSTGNPKGVLQNHRNALHYCMNDTNTLRISPEDRVVFLYSCSALGGILCIFYTLLNGASLYSLNLKEEGLTSLVNWLIQEEITIYHSFATLFRHFASTLTGVEQFPKIRLIKLGGEATLRTDVEIYKQYFSDTCILCASLGATETGTFRNYIVNKDTQITTSTVPIGYAVEDMQILLLDEEGVEVQRGEIGEIALKSKYLALGYWQKPELTSAVFQPDSKGGRARIYRTGDMGRLEPDGCLIHIGRKDFQVKIRGFRIEVTEIETAILDTNTIKSAVVIAREDIPGDKRLVAYIVTKQPAPTVGELRSYLGSRLPDYMLPSVFVFLDALPLTPNGKVDRLALPAPDANQPHNQASFIAPRNDVEQKLTEIWQEVLGIKVIGVRDNFFELGGHSLSAARIFPQIENKLGKQLPLAILLQAGTIEALAEIIQKDDLIADKASGGQDKSNIWSSVVKIQPQGSQLPLFFVHPLGGELLCYRDLAVHLGSDQPVYGLQPQGLDGKKLPFTKLEDIASYYIQEIKTIQPHGLYLLGGYSFGGIVAYEMVQQLHRQNESVGILVMIDTCRPGSSERLPFRKRISVHLDNVLEQGPAYIQQNVRGWSQWGKYMLKHKYKSYLNAPRELLNVVDSLPANDKHLEVIEANTIAQNEYICQVYPGKMILLRTEDKNRDEGVGVKYDPLFGWGDLVTGGLEIHYVPGSHLSLLKEPHVQVLAEKLKVCLKNAV